MAEEMHTKLFLDSGDPSETFEAVETIGFLDGQTTNPSLVAKNEHIQELLKSGKKFTPETLLREYKKIIRKVSDILPEGDISIEVYSDKKTKAKSMVKEAYQFDGWIESPFIKLPVTKEGLKAAEVLLQQGVNVNMTLCFSQQQAAAVHAITKDVCEACDTRVFVSPFIGRLDDIGLNGINLVENIIKMYRKNQSHVEVLAASIRSIDHLIQVISLESDAVTAPLAIYQDWTEKDKTLVTRYTSSNLNEIEYQDLDLNKPWKKFDIKHHLTDKGLKKFSEDWNQLLK